MGHQPERDTGPQRCRAITRRHEQCPRRAWPGSGLCLPHGRGAGAPKGNRNARKHGFYSDESYRKRRQEREAAQPIQSIDEQVAYLRVCLADAVSRVPASPQWPWASP